MSWWSWINYLDPLNWPSYAQDAYNYLSNLGSSTVQGIIFSIIKGMFGIFNSVFSAIFSWFFSVMIGIIDAFSFLGVFSLPLFAAAFVGVGGVIYIILKVVEELA